MSSILVVEDEASMREFLDIMLRDIGHDVALVPSVGEAHTVLDSDADFDLVLTDLKLGRGSGLDVLERVKHVSPHSEVIVITAFATTDSAIKAMKLGAYDYVTKPFKVEEVKLLIEKALEKNKLSRERLHLQRELEERFEFSNIIGHAEPMRQVYDLIRKVAPTRTSVLVCGESGTGKELAARAIHYNSQRREKRFVAVNCAAVTETLFESELFGHVKGAFTGAVVDKPGLFEQAHRGTLFLDEIGEVPLQVQVKLLRVLQDKTVTRVGGTRPTQVDVRIIAATNKDLDAEIGRGNFREDLYYRLNVIRIDMPTLRDRRDDIPLLVQHFLRKHTEERGTVMGAVEEAVFDVLAHYPFPGNVRELENIVERAITLSGDGSIGVHNLPPSVRDSVTEPAPTAGSGELTQVEFPEQGIVLDKVVESIERRLVLEALRRSGGVKTRAAELVGLSFRQFRYRLEKLNIRDDELN